MFCTGWTSLIIVCGDLRCSQGIISGTSSTAAGNGCGVCFPRGPTRCGYMEKAEKVLATRIFANKLGPTHRSKTT